MEKYMPEDMISEDDTEAIYEDPEPVEEEDTEYEELLKIQQTAYDRYMKIINESK